MMDNRNQPDPRERDQGAAGDMAEHTEGQSARGRAQSRSPFFAFCSSAVSSVSTAFASVREHAAALLQACGARLAAAAEGLSFRAIGQLMDSGALSRLTPEAWAALLSAAVLLLLALWGEMGRLIAPKGVWAVLLSFLGTLVCVLLPAVLGLASPCRPALRRRPVTAEQRFALAVTGAALVCPLSLLADLPSAVLARFGVFLPVQAAAAPQASLFLPMLLVSGVVAPLCEELFFRGVLGGLLRRRGEGLAAAVSALVFAAAHGADLFAVRALMGLLLYAIVRRTDSLAAGVIVHCLHNISLLLISFMGLGGLFSGLSLVSCALRLAGTAVFVAGLRRLWRARRPAMPDKGPDKKLDKKPAKLRLSQREWGMAAGAAALMILSQIIAGVMKG